MTNHVKAFTYEPKIKAVREGRCTQTIRPLGPRPVKQGDEILFHGWTGRPYRSPWSWRMRVTVTEVFTLEASRCSVINEHGFACSWGSPYMNRLAELDHIDPPTGEQLREVLFNKNRHRSQNVYQVIRFQGDKDNE